MTKKRRTLVGFIDHVMRYFYDRPEKNAEAEMVHQRKKELKEGGVDVVDFEAGIPYGEIDKKTRREIADKVNFRLYKAKDRKTLGRLEVPPIEEGIFVLHTGEFCAGTDFAAPWRLRDKPIRGEDQ